MDKCSRCGKGITARHTWQLNSKDMFLCDPCQQDIALLITDWIKIGPLSFPSAEILKQVD